ncbi:MAG TPA: farnesyl diphosphate synthase [candidate division Zixibacteria bacterium]|nr:farnesyl diphosphate synthase [candidate division Zixibacteria bacterium]
MNLEKYLVSKRKIIEKALGNYLPTASQKPQVLSRALRYAVLGGGKRLRPILVMAAAEQINGNTLQAVPAACAIELLHAFSLIHDDLPCIDNDDLRRGRPTLHKIYGEGIAVLAGDALMALAFQLLAQTGNLQILSEVAQAIGRQGMIGGQIADLEAEGKKIKLSQLEFIHKNKTAALIKASIRAGAILGGADAKKLKILSNYGEKIGLAFQIIDDILNVEGKEEKIGKKVGSDNLKKKATYPKIVGLVNSKIMAQKLTQEAKASLKNLPNGKILQELADYLLSRIK